MNKTSKKPNAYRRIRQAMRENEQWILKVIRRDGSYPLFGMGIRPIRIWNALDRLEAKRRIRLTTRQRIKVYVAVKKAK